MNQQNILVTFQDLNEYMDTQDLLNIINPADIIDRKQLTVNQWAHQMQFNVSQEINLSDFDFAIIGVEPVNGLFANQMLGGSVSIRKEIYQLFNWEREFRAIDLGNLIENKSIESQIEALGEICTELLEAEDATSSEIDPQEPRLPEASLPETNQPETCQP